MCGCKVKYVASTSIRELLLHSAAGFDSHAAVRAVHTSATQMGTAAVMCQAADGTGKSGGLGVPFSAVCHGCQIWKIRVLGMQWRATSSVNASTLRATLCLNSTSPAHPPELHRNFGVRAKRKPVCDVHIGPRKRRGIARNGYLSPASNVGVFSPRGGTAGPIPVRIELG